MSVTLSPFYINAPVQVGISGPAGAAGASSYLYVGYAEDDQGTGYSASPGGARTYIAFKYSATVIASPDASTFAGLWKKYVGSDGESATIADGSLTNAKLGDMAAGSTKGRALGSGTGSPVDLTAVQLRANAELSSTDTMTIAGINLNGSINGGAGERELTSAGWKVLGYIYFGAGSPIAINPLGTNEIVIGLNSRIRFLHTSTNSFVGGGAALASADGGVRVIDSTDGNPRDFSVRDLISSQSIKVTPTTLASQPTAATAGDGTFCNITDGATTSLGSVATGSGSEKQTLRSDGTNWRVMSRPV